MSPPKLLLLSGIGDANYLQGLGIPIVVDLPSVGQNFQDHLLVPVVYEATQDVHPAITSNGIEAGLFLHSEGNPEIAPDLQFFFGPIQFLPSRYVPSQFGFTGAVSLTHLQNVGSVGLRSLDPNDAPMFRMNYLQSKTDVQKLVAAIKLMRQLLQSKGLDESRSQEIAPGAHVQSDEAIEDYIRDTCSTVYHPIGTCKMGTDLTAVIDPELRVHGTEGLRVVDASVMPAITTGNTNAPTIMIGEKAADFIKASRTRQALLSRYNVKDPTYLTYPGVDD